MKAKLTLHYFILFIGACSAIFILNIIFMRSNIYNQGELYNYHADKIVSTFKNYINLSEDNKVVVNSEGIKFLDEENIGVQILDANNNEVFSYNKPEIALNHYSNVSLIEMYNNEDETLYLNEKKLNDNIYTYLLFLDSNKVKRVVYSYDVILIRKAHKFPILIGLNISLILIMSFLFTLRIAKPINRIIDKIANLSNGNYSRYKIKKGIYFGVEKYLNQLADRLQSNEIERKKLEDMREEWISNITHDIKTPLTSIRGNAEILSDTEYEIDDKVREKYCNTIISKSEYIKTLVEDLNLSTRLKNNTLVLNRKKVNIVSLVRHVLIDIINDEKYNDKNINFNYSYEEIFLDIDEQLMKRVFVNLIINAFVHNNDDVKLSISIDKRENDRIFISIIDDGKGVSPQELNNIFRRYYRGTNTKHKTEGSGLGMAIAYDIIQTHGAKIKAISNFGKGLKIEIIF